MMAILKIFDCSICNLVVLEKKLNIGNRNNYEKNNGENENNSN